MADQEKHSADEFLDEIHGEGASGTGLGFSIDVTEEDVLLYLHRHPYLQLLNLDPTFEEFDEVQFQKSSAGWTIQDFGDALSCSQGEKFFDDFGQITLFAESEEGDQGTDDGGDVGQSDLRPGDGTVIKQAFDTAVQMVEMVKERWKGVHIVAGSEAMKWAAWVAATELGLDVYGYEADKEAQARANRIRRYELQKGAGVKPGHTKGD